MADIFQDRASRSILQLYDTRNNQSRVLKTFDYVVEAPFFDADGKGLYYNAMGQIFRLNLEDGTSARIPTGEAVSCNNDHVLSPDGRFLAVSSGRLGDDRSRIYTVDLASGQSRLITPEPHSYLHGWSPDGKTLAFCGARWHGGELAWDVYTVDASGGAERQLTNAPGLNDGPEFSPDGKTIWFNSVRTGRMQVWKMNADGTQQTQMTFDTAWNSWFPHISPDGHQVVYLAYREGDLEPGEHLPDKQVQLRMIAAEGGEPRAVLELFGGQGTINVNSWSPDSRYFAFVSYEKQKELRCPV